MGKIVKSLQRFILFIPFILFPSCGIAATFVAHPPGSDIGAAYARMQPGDTLRLLPGEYTVALEPPTHISGRSWVAPTIIDATGARFGAGGRGIYLNSGWSDMADLAKTVGVSTIDALSTKAYLDGKVHEHLVLRGFTLDGEGRTSPSGSAFLCVNGCRRIILEDCTFRDWPLGGTNTSMRYLATTVVEWHGSSPMGRQYKQDITVRRCTFAPPSKGGMFWYLSGQGYWIDHNVFDGGDTLSAGINCNSATFSAFTNNTFTNLLYTGGNCTNSVWVGNTFLRTTKEIRNDTELIAHNTFLSTPVAIEFTSHRSNHYGTLIAGNIFEGVGTPWKGTNTGVVRDNLINQRVVDRESGAVLNVQAVGNMPPAPSISDIRTGGDVNAAETWAYWSMAFARWKRDGGHNHYGATPIEIQPDEKLPAPQNLHIQSR